MTRELATFRKLAGLALVLAGLFFALAVQLRSEPLPGDAPQFQNAHLDTRALQGSLTDELHHWISGSSKARWLGYSVPQVNGEETVCCSNYYNYNSARGCGRCKLENSSGTAKNSNEEGPRKINLENPAQLAVMFRAENGKLSNIRVFSMECIVDAGGLEVQWLDNVKASDSVALLEPLVAGQSSEDRHDSWAKGALTAIALHADASADRVLESFVSPDRPEWLRKETAFWLGQARGAAGFHTLQRMAQTEASSHVREQVTFALSVSREPGALTEMIRMAHEDQSSQVRGQALFWLAQKAGKQAETAITGAIQNDPDTEVKKKAVFALSQMPKDEGIPKLIEVAQTNKNPEVRKQAMFWLGQSQDPRALAFFEKILLQ